jgi:glycosyltransferase involved in cell wall biosynthesis
MQVIQCADFAAPYAGSFVPMLTAVCREAAARGHAASVLLPETARGRPWLHELEAVARVRFIDTGDGRFSSTRRALAELRLLLAGSERAAVIHSHFTEFDITAALERLVKPGAMVVWHEHSPLSDDRRIRLRNRLRLSLLSPLVSRILCVSSELRAGLRERGAPEAKLAVFPNAIDTVRFRPADAQERQAARQKLSIDAETRVILHFGWSWQRKGGDLMLDAAQRLGADENILILTVLGDDPEAPHRTLMEAPAVRVVEPANDVGELYAACDAFLSCSRSEGMPFAVMEATAGGLPVVVSDLPAQRELLSGLPGAAIVDPMDPDMLIGGVRAMLSLGADERAVHASQARSRIESTYALQPWAARLVDLYEGVLAERAR